MKTYHYECVYKKDYVQGQIKAVSHESAIMQVKRKFPDENVKCLRVYKLDNPFKVMANSTLLGLRTILIKVIPVALGIIILYLLYYLLFA